MLENGFIGTTQFAASGFATTDDSGNIAPFEEVGLLINIAKIVDSYQYGDSGNIAPFEEVWALSSICVNGYVKVWHYDIYIYIYTHTYTHI